MKLMMKFTAFFISMATLSSVVIPITTSANEVVDNYELEYVQSSLSTYLNFYDVDKSEIYISEPYVLYDLESGDEANNIYIVFEADTVIGTISVSEVSGQYYSSFEINEFNSLQDIYDNSKSFSFVCHDEQLYVQESDKIFSVDDTTVTIECNSPVQPEIELSRAFKVDIDQTNTRVHPYSRNLAVPFVQNHNINGGICWAAAIASKQNYINNNSVTALDVYYTLKNTYNQTPTGIPYWINKGFELYNIPCTTVYRMLDCVEIYNHINNNNPMLMEIFNSSGIGHAVVIAGITINSDASGVYRLVDSNRTTYVDVAVPADVMTADSPFVYVTNYGYTFDDWRRSHY